jgi:hypothetical protein
LLVTRPDTQDAIERRLARFSADFDAVVGRIKSEWIQVKTDVRGQGLFDFSVTDNQVAVIHTSVGEETTFEQLLDLVLVTLWSRLDTVLAVARERIATAAKKTLDDLMASLQSDIAKLAKGVDVSDLDGAIKSVRTELTNTLNRIAQWFQLPKQTSTTPFPIVDAVSIATESIRRFHRSSPFDPQVSIQEAITLPGLLLPGLVDVLIIAFENIVRHSDLSLPKVEVTVTADDYWIWVNVRNDIGRGVFCDAAVARVAKLREALESGGYRKSVAAEGCTGFHKIWKIIAHDLGGEARLDFGFSDETHFFVEIGIERPERI